MEKKEAGNKYIKMEAEARSFSKKLLEFAADELKDAEVLISDDTEDEDLPKFIYTASKTEHNIRIIIEYLYYDDYFSVEIANFSELKPFTFTISVYRGTEFENILPLPIRTALRNHYLKKRPDIN